MKTRDRIIEASLQLFNEQGERAVTTNHIAAHLGMSPGNLYYHFRNKQQIIAELFERYAAEAEQNLALPEGRALDLDDKATADDFESIGETMRDDAPDDFHHLILTCADRDGDADEELDQALESLLEDLEAELAAALHAVQRGACATAQRRVAQHTELVLQADAAVLSLACVFTAAS